MNMKHTKGEWNHRKEKDKTFIVNAPHDDTYEWENEVATIHSQLHLGVAEANAKLIAAAPELLKVLEEVEDRVTVDLPISQRLINEIRETIKKATE